MKKKEKIGVALVVLVILAISVYFVYSISLAKTTRGEYNVVIAKKMQNQTGTNFSGKLEAAESANIVSKISGKIAAINVDVGSEVREGDVLLKLDADDLLANVAQAQAALEIARSTLETSRIDYEMQKENFERNKTLVEQGAISKSDFDNKFAIPFAKAKENVLNGADAQVKQATANLQLAKANYQYSIVSSPINGIIAAKYVNVGELADSQVTLFSIINIDKIYVMASIDEENINQFKVGDQLQIRVGAVTDVPVYGVITNISQAAGTIATKTYLVKIQIDNIKHLFKPGMFAEVLQEDGNKGNIIIPKIAVINENGENYVWTVNEGEADKVKVEIGNADMINVQIKSGLVDGQKVITSKQESLKEGMRVIVE